MRWAGGMAPRPAGEDAMDLQDRLTPLVDEGTGA